MASQASGQPWGVRRRIPPATEPPFYGLASTSVFGPICFKYSFKTPSCHQLQEPDTFLEAAMCAKGSEDRARTTAKMEVSQRASPPESRFKNTHKEFPSWLSSNKPD